MLNKTPQYKIIVIIIIIALPIVACIASGGDSAEVEALQQQVDALATQNAILLEERQDSANDNDSGELDAPAPPSRNQDTQIEIADPTPETLPDEPVPAGKAVIYDGWAITVKPEILTYRGNKWAIEVFIRNLGETSRIFRYVNAGITASDNLGNTYDIAPEFCIEHHQTVKNLNIPEGDSTSISPGYWGNECVSNDGIHQFKGPIPLEASKLIIGFDDFGPFNDVEVIIDL